VEVAELQTRAIASKGLTATLWGNKLEERFAMTCFSTHPSRLPAILACCAMACATCLAGEVPSIKSIVEKFDAAQAKVETLQAPFTLSITRVMLKSPVVSKGTFYLSGSECANFTFSPPDGLVIHIAPKTVISYSPAEKRAETLKTRLIKTPNRKALALGRKLSYFSDFFKMDASEPKDLPGTLLVTLKPRSLSFRKLIEVIQVWIDRETYLPKRVNWVERGGDAWLIELGQPTINHAIPTSVSYFSVPAGTVVKAEFSFFKTRKEQGRK
jgi:outer membrane lipoprotein-sorting protein